MFVARDTLKGMQSGTYTGLGIARLPLNAEQLAVTKDDPFYVLYDPAFPSDYLFTFNGIKTAENPDGIYTATNHELAQIRAVTTRSQQGFQSKPNDSDVYQDWVRTVEADHSKYSNSMYKDSFARSWTSQGATVDQINNAFTYVPTFMNNATALTHPEVITDAHAGPFVKSPDVKTPAHVITTPTPVKSVLPVLLGLAAILGLGS